MKRVLYSAISCFWFFSFCSLWALPQTPPLKTIEIETTQVTSPDVAVTPDGQQLIFTVLGKLFRLPVEGGTADQLTFGPYYDSDPVISADGKLVAFASDRDGSESNIFILDLDSSEINQLTHEEFAIRPAWSPDGESVIYLNPQWQDPVPGEVNAIPPSEIKQVRLDTGHTNTLYRGGRIISASFIGDGRLAWSVVDRETTRLVGRIEALNSDGKSEVIRTFDHPIDHITPTKSPAGFLVRSFSPDLSVGEITFVHASGAVRRLVNVSPERDSFAVSRDGRTLYAGNKGHLWKVALPGGQMSPLPFRARVQLQVRPSTAPRFWKPVEPGETRAPRTILSPTLLHDGKSLIFSASGDFWHQPGDGSAPKKITKELPPGTKFVVSPDPDKKIAYVYNPPGKDARIDILDIVTGATRTVAPETRCGYEQLSWSPHGQLIAATACEHEILAIDPASGKSKVIAKKLSSWEPQPHLSADGKTLYLQAQLPNSEPGYYKLALSPDAKPEFIRPASFNNGTVKIAGEWIAESIANSTGIRLFNMSDPKRNVVIAEADGYSGFSISPDGENVVYSVADRVWLQPLDGTPRTDISPRFRSVAPTPPSFLVERVRILDFNSETFGPETSILLKNGRIKSIGDVRRETLPKNTTVVDAKGRYAIPGLFDMHGHGGTCGDASQIAHGVIAVRNMGGRIEQLNAFKDASELTDKPLPRCFHPGRILEGATGRQEDHYFVHPRDENDARRYVRIANQQGADFIKLYQRLPWKLQRAAADEAHRLGLPVVAHAGTLERSVKGLTLGYAGLTHGLPYYQDIKMMMQKTGANWDPTLGVDAGRELRYRENPERYKRGYTAARSRLGDIAIQGRWYELLKSVRSAHRLGIPIVPGTDDAGNGILFHWELEFLEEAGMAPIDVLRSASIQSAKILGADEHLGSIEVGKLADLVLLDADPLKEIRNTKRVWRVFKGGWMYDPKDITR